MVLVAVGGKACELWPWKEKRVRGTEGEQRREMRKRWGESKFE